MSTRIVEGTGTRINELITPRASSATRTAESVASPAPGPARSGLTAGEAAELRERIIAKAFERRDMPPTLAVKVREALRAKPTLTLTEARAEVDSYISALAPTTAGVHGPSILMSDTADGKRLSAFEGFFLGRDVGGVPRFESFLEAHREITGRPLSETWGRSCALPRYRGVRESITTGDWGEILADTVNRAMLAEYRTPSQHDAWRSIVSDITSPRDFRTNRRWRLSGYGDLSTVTEGAPYQALSSPDDDEVSYAIAKRGGIDSLSLEVAERDDVGAIRRIPKNLATAAKRTLAKSVFDVFRNNINYADGTPLADVAHGNLVTTALSLSAVTEARLRMLRQTPGGFYDEGGLYPKTLMVPAELEEIGWRLTSIPVAPTTNRNGTEPNLHRRKGLDQLIVLPYWSSADRWWIAGDPKQTPTIEVGFWNGRDEPEVQIANDPATGSMFTADKIDFRIRFIWGVVVLDYRPFIGGLP